MEDLRCWSYICNLQLAHIQLLNKVEPYLDSQKKSLGSTIILTNMLMPKTITFNDLKYSIDKCIPTLLHGSHFDPFIIDFLIDWTTLDKMVNTIFVNKLREFESQGLLLRNSTSLCIQYVHPHMLASITTPLQSNWG